MYTASLLVLALLTLIGATLPLWALRRSLRGARTGIWVWTIAPSAVLGWGSACAVWAMRGSPVLGEAIALLARTMPDLIVSYQISAGLFVWSSAVASVSAMRTPAPTISTTSLAVFTFIASFGAAVGLTIWAILGVGWSAAVPAWIVGVAGILLALASRRREQVGEDSRIASLRVAAAISLVAAVFVAASATSLGSRLWSLSYLQTFDANVGWWVQERRSAVLSLGWISAGAAVAVALIGTVPELGVAMGARFGRDMGISAVILGVAAAGTLMPAASMSSLTALATNQVQFEAGALLAQQMTERRLADASVHLDRAPVGDVVEYKHDGWMVTWRRHATGWRPAYDLVDELPPGPIAHPLVIAPSKMPVKTVVHLVQALPDGVPTPALLLRQGVTEFTLPADFAPLQYTHLLLRVHTGANAEIQALDAGRTTAAELVELSRSLPKGPVLIGVQAATLADLWHTCAGLALDLSTTPPTRTGRYCVIAATERAAAANR